MHPRKQANDPPLTHLLHHLLDPLPRLRQDALVVVAAAVAGGVAVLGLRLPRLLAPEEVPLLGRELEVIGQRRGLALLVGRQGLDTR